MNLPTDTELVEKAEADARLHIELNGIDSMRLIEAHLEALKIDRESYKWLLGAIHATGCADWKRLSMDVIDIETSHKCDCGLDAHLTTLRTRLGITE